MEEIQNNPNVPDDIKAVLSGDALDDFDDDELIDDHPPAVEPVETLEKYDMDMDESDDENQSKQRRSRRGTKKIDDDDWVMSSERQRKEKLRKPPRARGRPKRKSDEGTTADGAAAGVEKPTKSRKREPKSKTGENNNSTDSTKPKTEKTRTPKKPPVLPFNLLDLSKKFEGKIPTIKSADRDAKNNSVASVSPLASSTSASTSATTTESTSSSPSPIAKDSMFKRTYQKNPSRYFKSAITYPNPKTLLNSTADISANTLVDSSVTLSKLIAASGGYCDNKPGSTAVNITTAAATTATAAIAGNY